MTTPKSPLSILCFGDSLTEGYSSYGLRFTPYSKTLQEHLQSALGDEYEISVDTDGESGEAVTTGFLGRMKHRCTKKRLSILCFGASLVAGYSCLGTCFTPYSLTLKKDLERSLGGEYDVTIETDGVSGQLATNGFLDRMKKHYSSDRTSESPYDIVIFLGGTNDLGRRVPVPQIHAAITQITSLPLENGARLLLLTIPECAAKAVWLDRSREELNQLIWEDERDDVYTLDLFEKMPYHSLTKEQQTELWDDGLHFTPKGYEMMGHLVAERVLEILSPEAAKAKAK